MNNEKQNKFIEICNRSFFPINLNEYFNNDGVSYDNLKSDGAFDGSGSTFPAEELPASNTVITIDNIPFFMPSKEIGCKNNMVLRRQIIALEKFNYKNLFILGAVEGQMGEVFEEELILNFLNGDQQSVFIGLSNWLLQPVFGEKIAFFCSHIHYPDQGQMSNRNIFTNNSFVDYKFDNDSGHYKSKEYLFDEWIKIEPNDWKPKLWLQTIPVPSKEKIYMVNFDEENLNFHIFAMTFELEANAASL